MAEKSRFRNTEIETLNQELEGIENSLPNTNTKFGSKKINELDAKEVIKIL